jgi:hypothetical protein
MANNPGAVTPDVTRKREATRERVRRWRRRQKMSVTICVTKALLPETLVKAAERDSLDDSLFVHEVRSYEQLIASLVRRREQLDLSQQDVDALAGLQSGYTGKCEKPSASYGRIMGDMSFRTLLQTLGVKLLMVDADPEGKLRASIDKAKVGARRRGAKKKGKR